jgi:SAM-dependent methyltransferase
MTFEKLVAQGAAEPVDGWDFSWLAGRATEQRPSWGYTRTVVGRLQEAPAVLDIQTGGGEVFAEILTRAARRPDVLAATEGWPANFAVASARLSPFGVDLRHCANDSPLPFAADSFDLIISRHPTTTNWDSVAEVLRPGGTYLCQGIGDGTNHELSAALMGSVPDFDELGWQKAGEAATAAGLTIADLRHEALRAEFFDIGAVVYFLRKVIWTVPDFTVDRYLPELAALHDRIVAEGCFVSYARRYFIEARKPA